MEPAAARLLPAERMPAVRVPREAPAVALVRVEAQSRQVEAWARARVLVTWPVGALVPAMARVSREEPVVPRARLASRPRPADVPVRAQREESLLPAAAELESERARPAARPESAESRPTRGSATLEQREPVVPRPQAVQASLRAPAASWWEAAQ
ncbi:MAG TPA: hypothetical protein VFS60_05925 [Thermoanaerobaculia bacterium]|nr:hypothetical protein [Thermoanaerobaculia bacterium]